MFGRESRVRKDLELWDIWKVFGMVGVEYICRRIVGDEVGEEYKD